MRLAFLCNWNFEILIFVNFKIKLNFKCYKCFSNCNNYFIEIFKINVVWIIIVMSFFFIISNSHIYIVNV